MGMDELRVVLDEMISKQLYRVVLSNPRERGQEVDKVKVRPVMIGGSLLFQETSYVGNKVYHRNYEKGEMIRKMEEYLADAFCQCEISSIDWNAVILVSKKGKIKIKKTKVKEDRNDQDFLHNRVKRYILEEGKPVSFLVDLGVQRLDGQIIKAKYDKFRQINRYLEFVRDILTKLPKDRPVRIVDFGCGKSYLTFALYYYLHEMRKLAVDVTGLDLNADVIRHCNEVAGRLGYEELHFVQGDIAGYETSEQVDMVVSLHACNTATDYALDKAVQWGTKVIFAVPCCQHEVNGQLGCEQLEPLLKYGLIRERTAALFTDAIRANLLEGCGYDVQILEFIDMEHTPKNILIRAVKGTKRNVMEKIDESSGALKKVTDFLEVETTFQKLLDESSYLD